MSQFEYFMRFQEYFIVKLQAIFLTNNYFKKIIRLSVEKYIFRNSVAKL